MKNNPLLGARYAQSYSTRSVRFIMGHREVANETNRDITGDPDYAI